MIGRKLGYRNLPQIYFEKLHVEAVSRKRDPRDIIESHFVREYDVVSHKKMIITS